MAGGAQGIKAGRAYVELGTHNKVQAGLRSAQRRLKAFGSAVGAVGAKMMKMGALALAPLLASAKAFASMGDKIGKMAKRTGLTVEALSALEFAASQSGTSIESLEKGLKRMQQTIFDAGRGLSTAVDGLAALGLTYSNLAALAPEEQFKLIADRLDKVSHATDKAAIAAMVFGRAGTAMLPLIAGGAAGIDELIQKAEKYGLVISTDAARAAEEFTDAIDIAGRVVKMTAFEVGASLVPELMNATKWVIETTGKVKKWIQANRETIVSILKWSAALVAAGVVAVAAGIAIQGLALAIGALKVALVIASGAVQGLIVALTFLAAHPVIAIFAAIAAVVYLIADAFTSAADEAKAAEEAWQSMLDMEIEAKAFRKKKKKDEAEARDRRKDAADKSRDGGEISRLGKDLADYRRMQKEMRSSETDRIENVHERAVRRIKDRYAEERRKAKGQELTLMGIDLAESAALQTLHARRERQIAKTKADEKKRSDEAAMQKAKARGVQRMADEKQLQSEIARLEIQRTLEGHDQKMALIDLEERAAFAAAIAAGADTSGIRKKFSLIRQIADAGRKVAKKAEIGATGTFSARALWGMGGGKAADRTAKATEETAKKVGKILSIQQAGGLVFG